MHSFIMKDANWTKLKEANFQNIQCNLRWAAYQIFNCNTLEMYKQSNLTLNEAVIDISQNTPKKR